jgi:diguanylate cyclase (GGDEF)-like protein
MTPLRDIPVGSKLLVALTLSVGIALLVMLIVVSVGSLLRLQHQTQQQLTVLADVSGQNSQAALAFGDVKNAMDTLAGLQSNRLVATAAIYDGAGRLFAALHVPAGDPDFPALMGSIPEESSLTVWHLMSGRANLARPIALDGKIIGSILLVADLGPLWRAWLTEFTLVLIAAATAFASSLLLALYMRRLIAGPLMTLTRTVESVAQNQDYSMRVRSESRDEIGQLMNRFNDMLCQIETRDNEIRKLAYYDPLTHLPNRRLLLDRLQHALASCLRSKRQGALLFIDLDNFKTINDTLGHDKGDLLLEQVAQRLVTCVREGDTVARLGGDEFVIMLGDLSQSPKEAATQTEAVGAKVMSALNQPYQIAGHEYRNTPSIGVTLFGDNKHSQDELLKRADLAMYQAKSAGRNTLRFFDPEMQAAVTSRATLDNDLHEALRGSQFLLYYQPQVDDTRRLTGVEALLRWQHPLRGLVAPGDFISHTEETGLILPLGLWVLETACAQLVKWADQPGMAHLSLAVNVSARQFHQPDFVSQLRAVLDSSGANPKKLKLELTESLLLDDVEDTIAKMIDLKAIGVGFSLDDFGTGYSSLAYLKRLPLDQLKIDQSFVRDILSDPNDATIACTIVALAHSMGLAVIAEGVETAEQLAFLAANGCKAYQGYLFSRPLSLADFEKLARQTCSAVDAGSTKSPATDREPLPLLQS